MPRQKGPLKIIGSLEDINFYKGKKGYAVRMKGGVDKDRILSEKRFARTRENMTEFGNCATSGKYLRKAAAGLSLSAKDSEVVPRITKLLSAIKNMDITSARGKRTVAIGIQNPIALQMLDGLNFNEAAPIYQVLNTAYTVNTATGTVEIPTLIPAKNLQYPTSATNVSLISAFLVLDFASGDFNFTESPITNLPVDFTSTSVTLTPTGVPSGTGVALYIIGIQFFQEINGTQYPLAEGMFNCQSIIAVDN